MGSVYIAERNLNSASSGGRIFWEDAENMAKVTIDGTEYDTAEMPEETLRILASLNATDKQIRELSDQLAISRAVSLPPQRI